MFIMSVCAGEGRAVTRTPAKLLRLSEGTLQRLTSISYCWHSVREDVFLVWIAPYSGPAIVSTTLLPATYISVMLCSGDRLLGDNNLGTQLVGKHIQGVKFNSESITGPGGLILSDRGLRLSQEAFM